MKVTERTGWRRQRHTDCHHRTASKADRAGPTHLTGSITHTCPLFIHRDEAPEWTLLWGQCFKCFCVSLFVRHNETWDQCTSAFVSVCEFVCVCVQVLYICMCSLGASCVVLHAVIELFHLHQVNLSHRAVYHSHTHISCSHALKQTGTKCSEVYIYECMCNNGALCDPEACLHWHYFIRAFHCLCIYVSD